MDPLSWQAKSHKGQTCFLLCNSRVKDFRKNTRNCLQATQMIKCLGKLLNANKEKTSRCSLGEIVSEQTLNGNCLMIMRPRESVRIMVREAGL